MRTTCAHCTQPLSPRQQRRKGRYCSRRCCFANSLKQRAESVGMSPARVWMAKQRGCLIDRGDAPIVTARRCCVECGSRRNLTRNSKLCTVCQSLGYRWCRRGKHTATLAEMCRTAPECRTCRTADIAERRKRKRLARIGAPPVGSVPIKVCAQRMGYSVPAVLKAIKRGWMADEVTRVGNQLWIVDQPTYAPWSWALV